MATSAAAVWRLATGRTIPIIHGGAVTVADVATPTPALTSSGRSGSERGRDAGGLARVAIPGAPVAAVRPRVAANLGHHDCFLACFEGAKVLLVLGCRVAARAVLLRSDVDLVVAVRLRVRVDEVVRHSPLHLSGCYLARLNLIVLKAAGRGVDTGGIIAARRRDERLYPTCVRARRAVASP